MSFSGQTMSASTPGTVIGDIHLSRAILESLHAEIHNPELSRHKPRLEATGLLFGSRDADAIWLQNFEPVGVGAGDFLGAGEGLQEALGDCISAIRSEAVNGPALLGWYVSRSDNHPGLLDRDIAIHNAFFQGHNEVTVIWKREAGGHFALEIYGAKPGVLLSKNNHRVASWRSANFAVLPDEVHVMPVDSGNDELFLNVYRTAKSVDQADSPASWGRIRHYTERLIPGLGRTSSEDQDEPLSAGLIIPERTVPNVAVPNLAGSSGAPAPKASAVEPGSGTFVTKDSPSLPGTFEGRSVQQANVEEQSRAPDRAPLADTSLASQPQPNLLPPQAGPQLQIWSPPSRTSASVPKKKSSSFLRTAAWLLGTIIISVLTYVGAHLYLKPMLLNIVGRGATASVPASPPAVPAQPMLGLKVGQDGTALDLQWNPLYPPVQRAISGKLTISDGKATRDIEMDGTQLKSGHIAYIPVSGDVRFRLQVINSPSDTVTDSIRVLITPSETMPSGSHRYAGGRMPPSQGIKGRTIVVQPVTGISPSGPATSVSRAPTSLSVDQATHAASAPEDVSGPLIVKSDSSMAQFRNIPGLASSLLPGASAPRSFTPPSQEQASSGVSRRDLPLQEHPTTDPQVTPRLADRKVPVSQQPATTHPAPSPASSMAPVVQRPFTPPVAVHRQTPVIRPGILFNNVVVPVIVKISETGKVTSATLAASDNSIRPELAREALTAAEKWRFSPAKIGEKAISSEMKINFVFRHPPTN